MLAERDGLHRMGVGRRVPQEPCDDARGMPCDMRRVHDRLPGAEPLTHPLLYALTMDRHVQRVRTGPSNL